MSDFAAASYGTSVVSAIVAAGAPALVTIKKGSAQGQAQGNLNGCRITGVQITNVASSAVFVKLYVVSQGVTPVIGTTPVAARIAINANQSLWLASPTDMSALGLNGDVYFTVTGAVADSDTTNVPANGAVVNVFYY